MWMPSVVTMTQKVPLFVLFLPIFLAGCHSMKIEQTVYVKAGEMVTLHCPYTHIEANVTWSSYTSQEMDLSNMSSVEQNQMGIVIHERSLVILSATEHYQGNYSCSLWNTSNQSRFRLMVYTTVSNDLKQKTRYPITCYTQESCTLTCPDRNIPNKNTPTITSTGIKWKKMGESGSKGSVYFSSVDQRDHGVYTCTRSYLFQGETYNKTFTVILNVKTRETWKRAEILSPKDKDVFYVDLGSTLMINCTALLSSEFDEVFWFSENSFVDRNHSASVFYTWTQDINGDDGTKMTVSLIFKNVSEKDLSKQYTCKLESVSEPSSFVTITLFQKGRSSSLVVALSIVATISVIAFIILIYVKYKTEIAIFQRNTLGCYSSVSAVEAVVSDRIEQSRTVVLVPISSDPGPGSGLLTDYGAAVEQHSHVKYITPETNEPKRSGSLKGLDQTGVCHLEG